MFDSFVGEPRGLWQLPLLRLGAGGRAEVVVQRAEPSWCATHWFGDRQVICLGEDCGCEGCQSQLARVTGFVVVTAVVDVRERAFLLEVSPRCWAAFVGLALMESLPVAPGDLALLSRRTSRSGVRLEPVSRGGRVHEELATVRRCAAAMAILFGLPLPLEAETTAEYKERARDLVRAKLAAAMARS